MSRGHRGRPEPEMRASMANVTAERADEGVRVHTVTDEMRAA